jgi:FAD/FMN-containing dehydrogenase/Fe-S oxidoreductase
VKLEAAGRVAGLEGAGLDQLASRLEGALDLSIRRRAEYSSDASNYRVVPEAVVFPRNEADVFAVVEYARLTGTPLTPRGAGTSVAGNAIGSGIVLDFSKYMNSVIEVDPVGRVARVQPGVVMSQLQAAAAPHGLRFGPDPSTQARCTLGGMVGNNACGPRAVQWGRTADNVVGLRFVDGAGTVNEISAGFHTHPELEEVVGANLAVVRTEFGRIGRQVSGYSLEHLLPERGKQLAKMLVGTEGTLGIVLEATVSLVPIPAATALVVLGYADMPTAADDVVSLLPLAPLAIESMDAALVSVVAAHAGEASLPELPRGGAWLFVETSGADHSAAVSAAGAIAAASTSMDARIVSDVQEARRLWRIREDGVGLAGRTVAGDPAWPGWEDAAVPPERLGDYLRDFAALKARFGVSGLEYGHVADGCIHTRLDLPIASGATTFRAFLEASADLVASYGGSISGEHGDGRARSELLARMYSPEALAIFRRIKAVFDPDGIMNPGVIVDPVPLDASLRLQAARPHRSRGLALIHDAGDFTRAVHRCVGVGKCRADNSAAGGFMCPSYLATRDEKDSTRGRARVLQEMTNGTLVTGDWTSPEVADALDLCLSCKACGSDCPAGVDMASYKSEVLYRRYRRRPRPASHYSLGWLPRWLRLTAIAPRAVNLVTRIRPLMAVGLRLAGADPRRTIPQLSPQTFRSWWRRRPRVSAGQPRVALWVDSFTNSFSAEIGHDAVRVLEHLGYEVLISERQVCCGLTWISTGQLDGARRLLRRAVDQLAPLVSSGVPIVGLEPSCTAVLRSDILELLPEDQRARAIAANTFTLAEFLTAPRAPHAEGWAMPSLDSVEVVAQPHCHQHAVMGWEKDRKLLEDGGATVTAVAGCCGLAGNFGMELGHYEVSVAVAENGLLPALRDGGGAYFLADGFSCRTQVDQLAGIKGHHLAQLIASRLGIREES